MSVIDLPNITPNGRLCAERLNYCREHTLLAQNDNDALISLAIGSTDISRPVQTHDFASYTELRNALPAENDRKSKSIIVSLSSYGSYDPLRICKEDLQQLVIDEKVDAGFADVVASFGELPRYSEQGFACLSTTCQQNGSYSVSYLLRFAEQDSQRNWKIRQLGVYQKFSRSSNSSFWILLQSHPPTEDKLSKRLSDHLRIQTDREQFVAYPFSLHFLLFDTYLHEWRWYLQTLGKEYSIQSKTISTVRPGKDPSFGLTLNTLQDCKKLLEDIIPLPAIFEATREILDRLALIEAKIRKTETQPSVVAYHFMLNDVKRSAEVLIRQTQGIVDLLCNTLDLKNQQDAASISSHLFDLTLRTTKDSATIMVITVVTMLYLPATFVATFYGMNFFNFNDRSKTIQISREVWLYVVTFIPLTGLTLFLGWRWRGALVKSKDFGVSLELKELIP